MINSIGGLEAHGNSGLSKTGLGKKGVITFSENSAAGAAQQLDGNKDNKDVDPRDIPLKEAARDFEKIFVTYMIKDMWKAIPEDEDSEMPGSNIYLDMVQSALASEMVKGDGLGIAKMLYQQLKNRMKQDVM